MILKGSKELINKYRTIIAYEIHLNLDMDKNEAIKELLISSKYKIYLMNEILPDCRNVLAIPHEKDPVNIIDSIYNYLNNYDYKICLHVNDRFEVLKFKYARDAYYKGYLIKGRSHTFLDKDNRVLDSHWVDIYVKHCENYSKSLKIRDDYFIELNSLYCIIK